MEGLLGIKSVSFNPLGGHIAWSLLVLAAAIGFSIWAYKTTLPPVTQRSKGLLLTLRCLALALLALILLQPVLSVVAPHSTQPSLPILVDVSASMDTPLGAGGEGMTVEGGLEDRQSEASQEGDAPGSPQEAQRRPGDEAARSPSGGASRSADAGASRGSGADAARGFGTGEGAEDDLPVYTRLEAARQIVRAIGEDLSDTYRVPVYRFALDVFGPEPGMPSSLPDTAGSRYATALGEALEEVVLRREAESVVGVIVISDGAVNRGEDPLRSVRSIGVPIYSVVLGDTFGVPDCQISEIRMNRTAYVDAEVPLRAVIKSQGYEGRPALLLLKEGDQVLASKEVMLAGAGFEQEVDLSFVPHTPGERFLTLSLEQMEDEQTLDNNTMGAALSVMQEKLEVLYVEGRLSWEFTFLKRALEEMQNLRTHCLVAYDGRTLEALDGDAGPFPSQPDGLSGYSLIVLGDCDPSLLSYAQWYALVEYVRRGGGLLLLAGRSEQGLSRLATTPVSELMPIGLASGQMSRRYGSYAPYLTAAGREHPVTKVDVDVAVCDSLWGNLPPLLEVFLVGHPRSRSQVLVSVRDEARSLPVIAVRQFDQGKVMAVNSSSLWRWGFLSEGVLGSRTLYDRLWSNSVRWLTRKEDEGVKVFSESGVYASGEIVRIGASITGEGYRPVAGASVDVRVADSDGRGVARDLTLVDSDVPGHYEGGLQALAPGEYSLTAEATFGGGRLGSSTGRFRVDSAGLEFFDLRARGDLMRALAAQSGGSGYTIRDFGRLPRDVGRAKLEFSRTVEMDIWNHPGAFIALLALLGAEWAWRRRLGMV